MSLAFMVLTFTIGFAEPDKPVSDAEKKEFLELVAGLPTKGEFFTDEAVKKAAPHTRALLALTEKDLEKHDLYPLIALSSGLMGHHESRDYGLKHFAQIQHPTMKLAWAVGLFGTKTSSPEVLDFLCKSLDSKDDSKTLSRMLGPGYEDFKDRVKAAAAAGKQTKVELVKEHKLEGLPKYSDSHGYSNNQIVFLPNSELVAVRPLKQAGELCRYDVADGKLTRLDIPQPQGYKPEFELDGLCFQHPVVSVNRHGDIFCRWTNGDYALAILKKGADSFSVRSVNNYLDRAFVLADPDGGWFLIQGGPHFTVYQVDQELKLTELGDFQGKGFHSFGGIVDARFISKNVLHLFWGDVLPDGNQLRMRCVDFDVLERKWLHDREIFRLDKFVSSASKPSVLQLADGSLHYLWRIDRGDEQDESSGLYYQAEKSGKTVKISTSYDGYRAVAVGDCIVVCYTLKKWPERVFFCVIRNGAVGPVTEIAAAKGQEYNLWSEDMVLSADKDHIWFMNTLNTGSLYELKLVDERKP
jgi:hypothetical protein